MHAFDPEQVVRERMAEHRRRADAHRRPSVPAAPEGARAAPGSGIVRWWTALVDGRLPPRRRPVGPARAAVR